MSGQAGADWVVVLVKDFDQAKQRLHPALDPGQRRELARENARLALAAPPLLAQRAPLTAQQVVERIQKNAGVPWQPQSLDTFKAGDPSTPVTGVATTGMAT